MPRPLLLVKIQIFVQIVPLLVIIGYLCLASDSTCGRKVERLALEELHLVLLLLLLLQRLFLLLLDLIFLKLMQHVTKSAIHLSDSPVEASNDAPCAQGGHLTLL